MFRYIEPNVFCFQGDWNKLEKIEVLYETPKPNLPDYNILKTSIIIVIVKARGEII